VSDHGLLRIGPFARASSLSIKSLRAYHESGLLVPAVVDPQSGYRSYSVAQLTDAAIIRRLRQLDLPLEAVRAVLDARDPAVTAKVLAEHGAVLEARLAATQRMVTELQGALETPSLHTPVHRRFEEASVVLSVAGTVSEAEWPSYLERAFTLLVDTAAGEGAVIAGPCGGCYPPPLDDDHQAVEAFLPVVDAPLLSPRARSAGVQVGELPATEVAVLAHVGSYDHIDETYRRLGAWVAANAEPADLPVRERYLVGPDEVDDPDGYRTEISWPIHPPAPG
jgi:DNA-binding transcriptional MerR regulator